MSNCEPMPGKEELNGWEDVLCNDGEMPKVFFEYRFSQLDPMKRGSVTLYEKNGLWSVKDNLSSEFIAKDVPYCEADRKIFENFNIHAPDVGNMSKYGVRVCS